MQEQIDKIEIVLENCEIITIKGEYIGDLDIKDIRYSIGRIGCNYIDEAYTCEHFSMSINNDASLDDKVKFTLGDVDERRNPLERIMQCNDIVSIDVYFKDKKQPKEIYMPWDGDDNQDNEYQKTYMNQFGDLYIVVDREADIKDFFDLETIEDKECRDVLWDMFK